jgi:SAM-dependent methyltransferase
MKEVFLWCVNTRNKNKTNSFFTNSRWGLCYNPFYFVRKELYEGIAKHAPHLKGKLIDLGCGTKPYQHLFTQVESYTGLDIAVSGNSDGKSAIDLYYDGVTFPLENNSIDVLFSSETFEHIFNLPVIVAEIQRVVKPGGHILITCPFFWPEHEVPYDYARYSSFAITHMLNEHGFDIVEHTKTGHYLQTVWQAKALYRYFIINRIPWLKPVLFLLFITPLFLWGSLLNKIMPQSMKRKDLYLNHIILAKKR